MYGGGFATVPAYLADIFGTQYVGAIHGRLLTAWSTAGIVGPVVVNYIREFNKAAGVPADRLYDVTMYVLAGFLVLGLICNALVQSGRSEMADPRKGGAAVRNRARHPVRADRRLWHRRRPVRLENHIGLARRGNSAGLGRAADLRQGDDHLPLKTAGPDTAVSGPPHLPQFRNHLTNAKLLP